MTVIAVAAVLFLGLVVAIDLAMPKINDWLVRRRDTRKAAMEAEMEALLAAQRLSLLAWQTRQKMHEELMKERRRQKSKS